MTQIHSATGPINTEDLGFTLMHEHIFVASWTMRQVFPDWFDRDTLVPKAVAELKEAKKAGVNTIVDLTAVNLGRDIHLIREVAEKSEMQIIVATGLYHTEEPMFGMWDIDQMVEIFLPEITDGISGTSSRANIIKCATDNLGVTEYNEKVLRMTARLHKETGVPISTHTDVTIQVGLNQQDIFEDEGVDLSRVVIGHSGDSEDIDYLEALLKRGSFIGMDRFGSNMLLPTDKRIATIVELCQRGWANKMVLGHDYCCHTDWAKDFANLAKSAMPSWNFLHISQDVVPELQQKGVSDDDIHAMTVLNPQRVFGGL